MFDQKYKFQSRKNQENADFLKQSDLWRDVREVDLGGDYTSDRLQRIHETPQEIQKDKIKDIVRMVLDEMEAERKRKLEQKVVSDKNLALDTR